MGFEKGFTATAETIRKSASSPSKGSAIIGPAA
jgi:hypothetical protein